MVLLLSVSLLCVPGFSALLVDHCRVFPDSPTCTEFDLSAWKPSGLILKKPNSSAAPLLQLRVENRTVSLRWDCIVKLGIAGQHSIALYFLVRFFQAVSQR